MSQPTPYTPTTDFSAEEASNTGGRSTVRTAPLDAEFANIETTLDQTLANLALIQRDDGKLKDALVEVFNLSAAAKAALGVTPAIETMAESIANVNAVAGDLPNVNAVAADLPNVDSLAADLPNVDAVAGGITNVNAVAGDLGNINTVAGNTANVNTVAGISGNVSTVAGISANVTAVAGNAANVNTVAGSISSVVTAATYITVIQQAVAAGRIFSSGAAGDASGTLAVNDYFWVISASSLYVLELWRKNGTGGADTGKRVSSPELIEMNLEALTGLGTDAIVTATQGDTIYNTFTGDAATSPNTAYGAAIPVQESGLLTEVNILFSAPGSGYLHIYKPLTDQSSTNAPKMELEQLIPLTASATGVNTFKPNVFVRKGSFLLWQQTSGGSVRGTTTVTPGLARVHILTAPQVVGNQTSLTYADGCVSIQWKVVTLDTLLERINANKLNSNLELGHAPDGTSLVSFDTAAITPSGLSDNIQICCSTTVTPYRAKLESVSVNIDLAAGVRGTGLLVVLEPKTDGNYLIAKTASFYNLVGGVNTLDVSPLDIIPASGSYICWVPNNSARLNHTASGSGNCVSSTGNGGIAVGITIDQLFNFTLNDFNFGIGYTLRTISGDVGTKARRSDRAGENVLLHGTDFLGTALPTGWTTAGAAVFTVSNGLTGNGVGSWATSALSPNLTCIANRRMRARVRIDDVTSVVGLCTGPIETASGSAVAMIDGAAGFLRMYRWDGSTAGTLVGSTALPGGFLVAGREYWIEVKKTGYINDLTLTDRLTRQAVTLQYSLDSIYAQFHGNPGVLHLSGNATWLRHENRALYKKNVRAVIIGDSIAERSSGIAVNGTWAFQLAALRTQGDILVAARSGESTDTFQKRMYLDLKQWAPQRVVIALGTNDGSQGQWRIRMRRIIQAAEDAGASIHLCTYIPRPAKQAQITAQNTDLFAGYFGNYPLIDHALAVSLNGDRVTWDPVCNSGDNTHPNSTGHTRLLAQTQLDAPELVD